MGVGLARDRGTRPRIERQITMRLPRRAAPQPEAPTTDKWLWQPLTRDEAAAFLNLSAARVSQLVRSDDLPCSYALGRQSPRYFRSELLEWLKARRDSEIA